MTFKSLRHALRRFSVALSIVALSAGGITAGLAAGFAGDARAQSYDEGMHAYNTGDFAKAVEVWGPLAENGDAVAQYSLGKLLENGGAGVPHDLVAAAKWYQRSASQGISAAQNNLGLMYAQGRGVPQDVARAAKFWRDAAAKDHVIAQFNLALAYFRGEGVAEDKAEALRWFRRASELGLADAQYALGQVVRLGLAGEADEAEALYWYQQASAQGHVKGATQAQLLHDAKVVARMPPGAPEPAPAPAPAAVVASEPPPPIPVAKPATKPVQPEPAPAVKPVAKAAAPVPAPAPKPPEVKPPKPVVAATPEPKAAPAPPVVASTPEPKAAPAASTPAMAGGAYSAWLVSFKDAAGARAYLRAAQTRHPALFAAAPGAVSAAKPGQGRTYYRVLAGGLASRPAARDLCRRLRAAEPGAFCKVLAN
jgi:hypothetical protein